MQLVSYISHSLDIDYGGFSLEIVEFHIGWDRAWKSVYKWETSLTLQAGFVRVVLGPIQKPNRNVLFFNYV